MVFAVGLFEINRGNEGVELGCMEMFMAQQFLDVADITSLTEHMAGTGAAQDMGAALFGNTCLVLISAQKIFYCASLKSCAQVGQKEGVVGWIFPGKVRACFIKIALR